MSSPNKNSAEMNAWLASANAHQFVPSKDFGDPAAGNNQSNPTDSDETSAALDGTLDD